MSEGDAMFDACLKIAMAIHEQVQHAKALAREQRNARRRAAYRHKPKAKTAPPTPCFEPNDKPEACYCNACRMPPCSWCTDPCREEELCQICDAPASLGQDGVMLCSQCRPRD
jgi:hypothetical protein